MSEEVYQEATICDFRALLAESPSGYICSVTIYPAFWQLQEGQRATCLRCDLVVSLSVVLQIWGWWPILVSQRILLVLDELFVKGLSDFYLIVWIYHLPSLSDLVPQRLDL